MNKLYKTGVASVFVDTIASKYAELVNYNIDDLFKVDLSTGAIKPLTSGYVSRGVRNLKTDAMVESIAQCMKNHGLLDEARLETTYQRALRLLGESTVAVPDEFETEEDLRTVQDENAVEVINEEEFFKIEVNQE
jgi:hypothetical protein